MTKPLKTDTCKICSAEYVLKNRGYVRGLCSASCGSKQHALSSLKRRRPRQCLYCGATFSFQDRRSLTCSAACGKGRQINGAKLAGRKHGGYRERSGTSKKGYYRGIYCASTYELAWVIYELDHGRPVTRSKAVISLPSGRRHYPDFDHHSDDKTVVEIKGRMTEDVYIKKAAAESAGYTYILLDKEALRPVFDYVETSRGIRIHRLHQLYDT